MGNPHCCDKQGGISLLSTAEKILARVINNRLAQHNAYYIVPESQRGFRASQDMSDMMFFVWQVEEDCLEQNRGLYMVFVDLTKAFDSVGSQGL